MKPVKRNVFHWVALILATLTTCVFLVGNYRGIFAWEGIGVYTLPFYGVGFILAVTLWLIGQLKSHSRDSFIFWIVMLLPIVFMIALPFRFYV